MTIKTPAKGHSRKARREVRFLPAPRDAAGAEAALNAPSIKVSRTFGLTADAKTRFCPPQGFPQGPHPDSGLDDDGLHGPEHVTEWRQA